MHLQVTPNQSNIVIDNDDGCEIQWSHPELNVSDLEKNIIRKSFVNQHTKIDFDKGIK